MMRPLLRSERQWMEANLVGAKQPLRCIRTTLSHSSSVMLKIIRSRRMPVGADQDVELPPRVERQPDGGFGRVHVGDVAKRWQRLAAGVLDLLNHGVDARGIDPHASFDIGAGTATITFAPCSAKILLIQLPCPRHHRSRWPPCHRDGSPPYATPCRYALNRLPGGSLCLWGTEASTVGAEAAPSPNHPREL